MQHMDIAKLIVPNLPWIIAGHHRGHARLGGFTTWLRIKNGYPLETRGASRSTQRTIARRLNVSVC